MKDTISGPGWLASHVCRGCCFHKAQEVEVLNGIIASRFEQHVVDHGVAVALLLAIVLVLVHLVWQPAKRLSIIQWSLVGGLLLVPGLFVPMQLVSLGLLTCDRAAASDSNAALRTGVDVLSTIPKTGLRDDAASSIAAEGEVHSVESRGDGTKHLGGLSQPPQSIADVESDQPSHVILWAYITGSTGMMIWLAVGQWRVRWLMIRAREANGELARSWEQLLCGMRPASGSRREVRLLVSDHVSYPMAVGIVRPAVLLPQWLVATRTAEELLPVLAHEAAHTLHRDAVLRWVAAVFQVAFFYQPFYWWLRRELRLCQEYLADSQAVAYARSAPEYAEQLVSLLNAAPKQYRRPLPTMGIVEGRSELFRRIQMLVQSSRRLETRGSVRWNLTIGGALLALAQCLGFVTLWAAETSPSVPAKSDGAVRSADVSGQEKPPAAEQKPTEVIGRFLKAMNDGEATEAEMLLSPKSRETNNEHHFCDGGGKRGDTTFIIQDATYPFRDTAHVPVSFGTDGTIYVLKRREGQWLVTGMIGLFNSRYEVVDFEDAQSFLQLDGGRIESPAEVVNNYYAALKRGDFAAAREYCSPDARQLSGARAADVANGEPKHDQKIIDYRIKSTSFPFGETAHVNVEATQGQAEERRTDDSIWILKRRQGKWRITGIMITMTEAKLPPTADAAARAAFEKWTKDRTEIIDFENPETHFQLP